MADIEIRNKGGRRRPPAPKVDLTPMVDLGFILICFFIYTTTMTESKALVLDTPYNPPPPGEQTVFVDTSTITIIPVDRHQLVYYNGVLDEDKLMATDFKGIRTVLLKKQSELKRLPDTYSALAHELQVIIKPSDKSTYQDFVAVLDEMLINKVKYYAVADITEQEKILVAKK